MKYKQAIKYRENILSNIKANPPKEWSAEYLQENIDEINKQIIHLKKLK